MEVMGTQHLDIAREHLGQSARSLERAPQHLVPSSARHLLTHLREEAPDRSGTLRRSLGIRLRGHEAEFEGAGYTGFVIKGTRPHVMNRAVSIDGEFRYIGTHPGTRANDFRRRAVERPRNGLHRHMRTIASEVSAGKSI